VNQSARFQCDRPPAGCDTLIAHGPARLRGDIEIGGFKHALVTCVAAAAASNGWVRIHACPDIDEARVLAKLVRHIGGRADIANGVFHIDGSMIDTPELPLSDVASIHGSIYLLPALLARFGAVTMPRTGGCQIGFGAGHRPTSQYAEILERFGATTDEAVDGSLTVSANQLTGCEIDLLDFTDDRELRTGPLYSGATKLAFLTAAVAHGTTVIRDPYPKPDVTELVTMLQKLGVAITMAADGGYSVAGQCGAIDTPGVDHTLIPDLIEIVTWICAGAVLADRPMTLRAQRLCDAQTALAPELHVLRQMGVRLDWAADSCLVHPSASFDPVDITVSSPGVYSDSQPLIAILAAHATGKSTITETVWVDRFRYAEGFAALGFEVEVISPRLTLSGGGSDGSTSHPCLAAQDLRGAASLLLAALTVPGTTTLHGMHHLTRGYTNLPAQLIDLGAHIEFGVAR
jgi:UDP-N-acetylglucosamine enolpyruvyl transferase